MTLRKLLFYASFIITHLKYYVLEVISQKSLEIIIITLQFYAWEIITFLFLISLMWHWNGYSITHLSKRKGWLKSILVFIQLQNLYQH